MAWIFSKIWPKSLYRQILLVAALALFFAQAINAVLLINSVRNRSAAEAAALLISRVSLQAERQLGRRSDRSRASEQNWRDERWRGEAQGRRQRSAVRGARRAGGFRSAGRAISIEASDSPPILTEFTLEKQFTLRADDYLTQGETDLRDVRLFSGPVAALPETLRKGPMRSRFVERLRLRGERLPSEAILLIADTGNGQWISAAALVRPITRGAILAMLLQTITLYIAVMVPLAIVAGRIVRPLERLTERVRRVGLTDDIAPLESEGPSDIRKLVESFNAMQARVNSLLDEKNVMLGAIGHDLKTPLAALRVRVESVENNEDREKMAATIDEMVIILDDILTLARLGKSGEMPQRTDMGALVGAIADEFAASGEPIKFEENQYRILAPVRPVLIRRALRNLISNALEHGGNADVAVIGRDDLVSVRVADAGPGIPTDQIEEIFAPFARLETSRNRATGGSGLGLTIARAIARAHGGDVRLENKTGGGLIAWIDLPAEMVG